LDRVTPFVRCLACGQSSGIHSFNEELKILQCGECGAIQLESEFKKKIHDRKSENIGLIEKSVTRLTYVNASKLISDQYMEYLKLHTDMKFKTALDIGANFGVFVKDLNNVGIDAEGIESNQRSIFLAVTKKIKWAYFDEDYIIEKKYDLICLTQMIYYQRDNFKLLNRVKNMLKGNGLIFISTLNPLSTYIKSYLQPQGANMIFSKKNFESLHDKLGLALLDYSTYRTDYYLDLFKSKHQKLTGLKYFLGLKKTYVEDPNGNHAFILLKPTQVVSNKS
jgi:2-polyprenyl-3-methyl-5-hydroxy-6-metoxy-1,4-benzoquinol methylase